MTSTISVNQLLERRQAALGLAALGVAEVDPVFGVAGEEPLRVRLAGDVARRCEQPVTITPCKGQAGNVSGMFTTATCLPAAPATSQNVGSRRSVLAVKWRPARRLSQ